MTQQANKNVIIEWIKNVLNGKVKLERDSTPNKIKKMNKAIVHCPDGNSHVILISKKLCKRYKEIFEKYKKGEKLTPLEKTYLEGYLNPKYRYASIKYKQ